MCECVCVRAIDQATVLPWLMVNMMRTAAAAVAACKLLCAAQIEL